MLIAFHDIKAAEPPCTWTMDMQTVPRIGEDVDLPGTGVANIDARVVAVHHHRHPPTDYPVITCSVTTRKPLA